MATVRLIRQSGSSAAKQPIYLRLQDRGKRIYFATPYLASEAEWDSSGKEDRFVSGRGVKAYEVSKKVDGKIVEILAKDANTELAKIEDRAKKILEELKNRKQGWTFEDFKSRFEPKQTRDSFKAYALEIVCKNYEDNGKFATSRVIRDAITAFEAYDKKFGSLEFADITPAYVQKFIEFSEGLESSVNTISIRLRAIRRVFNIAIQAGVCTPSSYPFSRNAGETKITVKSERCTKTNKYLCHEDLCKFANYHFENQVLERTKHLFLFSLFAAGLNWQDMAFLTTANIKNGILSYRRSKTRKVIEMKVDSNLQRELDWFRQNTVLFKNYLLPIITHEPKATIPTDPKYKNFSAARKPKVMRSPEENLLLQIRQSRKRFNAYLREAAGIAGVENVKDLSVYSARHSFAVELMQKGSTITEIKKALGHSSISTTENYLADLSLDELSKATHIDLGL